MSERLQLQLHVESTPNQGSCFTLQLRPASAALIAGVGVGVGESDGVGDGDGGSPQVPEAPTDVLMRRRVLIINNRLPSGEAMALLLLGWGCEVWRAVSLREALAQVGTGRVPEFVVADLCLPGGDDGCHATLRLRELVGGRLPAVIVTADPGQARAQAARDAGFVVLAKPVRPVQLRAFMNNAFACDGCGLSGPA